MSEGSEIRPFRFESWEVRFVGTADVPEWVARDVVLILYGEQARNNIANYLAKVPPEWKGIKQINTPGGKQEVITIFEPGLYCLIARSESPLAVQFQKWVYEDVLPSIRKTGSYSVVQPQNSAMIPPARERLEDIRLGMDLLYELGGIDERTQLALRDIVRDTLLEDKLKKPMLSSSTGRFEWPVSDRAKHLGYKPNKTQLQRIGKTAANFYRLANNNEDPPRREQFVDGTTRPVFCYGEAHLELLDRAISLVMEPPAQLPPADDYGVEF